MGFVVCTINFNLVMESGTRKGRGSRMSLSIPWPFFVRLWRWEDGKGRCRKEAR